jgi:hypothetical protein
MRNGHLASRALAVSRYMNIAHLMSFAKYSDGGCLLVLLMVSFFARRDDFDPAPNRSVTVAALFAACRAAPH